MIVNVVEHLIDYLLKLARDDDGQSKDLSERIASLDVARENLVTAIAAIDELKGEAEANRVELASALERLHILQDQKSAAELELASVRQIAATDIAVFQKLAGIPSRRDVLRERLVGFLLGLLASLGASLLWWLGARYLGAA